MNKVVAGFNWRSRLLAACPSTLERKCALRGHWVIGASAWQIMRGPRSEPPMPMLTTSVMGWPLKPRHWPCWTARREVRHPLTHRLDLRQYVLAMNLDRATLLTQGDVQRRPILSEIDRLTGKHARDLLRQFRLLRQLQEQPTRVIGHAILGVIQQQTVEFDGKVLEALGIGLEHLAQGLVPDLVPMMLEGLPGRQLTQLGHSNLRILAMATNPARPFLALRHLPDGDRTGWFRRMPTAPESCCGYG